MKFGPRKPSLRGRISARTSWKRFVRHSLGLKAPRGFGWLTNPKKALYNRIYNRTTFDVFRLGRDRRTGCGIMLLPLAGAVIIFITDRLLSLL